jgi:CBS domain-containing protein
MVRTADTDFYGETMANIDLSPALVLTPDTALGDVIRQMQQKRCGCTVVAEGGRVLGTFTERTVIQKVLREGVDLASPVGPYANPEVPVLGPGDRVATAVEKMHAKNVRHLPVSDGKTVLGVLSVRDVIALVAQYNPEEIYNLPPRVRQEMKSVDGA